MPRRKELVSLPSFPGILHRQVELAPGYEFGRPRGGRVDIFKKKTRTQARQKAATLQCECNLGSGGCELRSTPTVAFCDPGSCKNCGFVIVVTNEAFVQYLGQVFRQ